MNNLKPCPCCKSISTHQASGFFLNCTFWVVCENCGLSSGRYDSAESATTAWNTRASDDAADALRESHARLLEVLIDLVKVNESHNAAVATVIGHPSGWTDAYLDKARAAIDAAAKEKNK